LLKNVYDFVLNDFADGVSQTPWRSESEPQFVCSDKSE
jgi:hypothetical protein